MKKDAYTESSNKTRYVNWRNTFDSFHKSEQWALKESVKDGFSVLDIGCASGGLSKALSEKYNDISYTGIDFDNEAIENGKSIYKDIELIYGRFPEDLDGNKKYDCLIMFGMFPHQLAYKEMLYSMTKISKRYITFNGSFRLQGNTIADDEVSFFYYLDSGKRIPLVVHNIFELICYLCTEKINAKKIKFYGYHIKEKSHIFYPFDRRELIKGNIVIELLDDDKEVKRVGGIPDGDPMLKDAFFPDIEIIVDGEKIPFF